MAKLLIIGAVIVILCVLCSKFSNKAGIPILLVFIGLGMLFGSDGLLKIEFSNYKFAGEVCSVALIFIIFYGGFGTKWSEAKPIAAKAALLSILFQGTLLPFVSRKLNMIDKNTNVLKTFNDYSEENEIQFIRLKIKSGSPWINERVKNISLPPETLLVMVQRGEKSIAPRGNTQIKENDKVILCAKGCPNDQSVNLKERTIDKNHKWCGKYISELELSAKSVIMIVMRNGKTIIPNGRLKISEGDTVVINSVK